MTNIDEPDTLPNQLDPGAGQHRLIIGDCASAGGFVTGADGAPGGCAGWACESLSAMGDAGSTSSDEGIACALSDASSMSEPTSASASQALFDVTMELPQTLPTTEGASRGFGG